MGASRVVAVGPKTWNANVTAVDGDVVTAEFGAKWRNYHDGGGLWLPIDPSFTDIPGSGFEHTTSPWSVSCPRYATGRIAVYNDQDYNPHTGTTFTLTTTPALELDHPDASPVEGIIDPDRPSRIVYPNALGDNVDLAAGLWPGRYPRAEHLVIIRGLPTGDMDAVITERIYTPLRIPGWTGSAVDVGATGAAMLAAGDSSLGIRMRPAVAWYYDQSGQMVTCPVSVVVERRLNAGYVLLTKTIPRWFIAEALAAGAYVIADETTTTYYPDADTETTSVDGYVGRTASSDTYATIRGGAGVYADDATSPVLLHYLRTNASTNSRYADMARGVLLFDTSSVLSGYTVTAVTLEVYTTAVITFGSAWTSRIVASTPASNTSLTSAGYQQVSTTIKDLGGLASGSISANAYCLWNLATDSVTKGGITKLGGRSAGDIAASPEFTTKGLTNGHQFQTAEGANPPKLTVTYTGGGGGGGGGTSDGRMMPRGVGRGIMRGCA